MGGSGFLSSVAWQETASQAAATTRNSCGRIARDDFGLNIVASIPLRRYRRIAYRPSDFLTAGKRFATPKQYRYTFAFAIQSLSAVPEGTASRSDKAKNLFFAESSSASDKD